MGNRLRPAMEGRNLQVFPKAARPLPVVVYLFGADGPVQDEDVVQKDASAHFQRLQRIFLPEGSAAGCGVGNLPAVRKEFHDGGLAKHDCGVMPHIGL